LEALDVSCNFLFVVAVYWTMMEAKRQLHISPSLDHQSNRINALSKAATKLGLHGWINIQIYDDDINASRGCACFGVRPNMSIVQYLNWAFRSSFLAVVLSATAAFFVFTIFFALIILGIGLYRPDCVHVNGQDFGTTGANFLDAYALSWTTFSTVVSGCTSVAGAA
jgi:hypothetical protein